MTKIKRIHEQLKYVGDLVPESNLVLHCLHGLNSAFDNFVMMIENVDVSPCFASLKSKLLVHEQRIARQSFSQLLLTITWRTIADYIATKPQSHIILISQALKSPQGSIWKATRSR